MAELEYRVYAWPDAWREAGYVGSLTADAGRQFQDVLNEVGQGNATVELGHADLALLRYGRVVKVKRDGQILFSWRVDHKQSDVLAVGEESSEVTVVGGRGCLSLWDDVVLWPYENVTTGNPKPPDQRWFDFTALDYDDSFWLGAVELKRQDDADDTKPWFGFPDPWYDYEGFWINSRDFDPAPPPGTPPHPVGKTYFRGWLHLAEQHTVRVYVAADDGYEVWLNNALLMEETQAFRSWQVGNQTELLLDAGDYLFGLVLENITRDSVATNVSGIIFAVVDLVDGEEGDVLLRSDGAWLAYDYPGFRPGMNPGQIMIRLWAEASGRGAADNLRYDWTPTHDSDGNLWGRWAALGFPVGETSYLAVLQKLAAQGTCDIGFDHDGLKLRLFNTPHGTDRTGTVVLSAGGGDGLSTLKVEGEGVVANRGLTRLADGTFVDVFDAASRAAFGTIEGFVSLGTAHDQREAQKLYEEGEAGDHAWPKSVASFALEPAAGDPVPYSGVFLGDTVTAPDEDGVAADQRVRTFAVGEDPEGGLTYSGEFFQRRTD